MENSNDFNKSIWFGGFHFNEKRNKNISTRNKRRSSWPWENGVYRGHFTDKVSEFGGHHMHTTKTSRRSIHIFTWNRFIGTHNEIDIGLALLGWRVWTLNIFKTTSSYGTSSRSEYMYEFGLDAWHCNRISGKKIRNM